MRGIGKREVGEGGILLQGSLRKDKSLDATEESISVKGKID